MCASCHDSIRSFVYLHPLFVTMPEEDRQILVQRSELREYRRNDIVLKMDESSGHIFCVGSGLLRVTVGCNATNVDVTTDFIRQGDFFLCRNFMEDTFTAEYTVMAALPASVYAIPIPVIRDLCLKHPSITIGMLGHVTDRAMMLRGQLRRVSSSSSVKLVSKILHELTLLAPAGDGGYDKRITQTVIASYSGLSREQVNKTMRDMELRGLVRKDGPGVHVPVDFGDTNFNELAPPHDDPDPPATIASPRIRSATS